jgi:hypothetical protein
VFVDAEPLIGVFLRPILLLLAVVQAIVDYRLGALRTQGERGYKMPMRFPFTYVSGPSYLLEILIWIGWGS